MFNRTDAKFSWNDKMQDHGVIERGIIELAFVLSQYYVVPDIYSNLFSVKCIH